MNAGRKSGCAYPNLRQSLARHGRAERAGSSGLNAESFQELQALVSEGSVEQFLCLQRAVQVDRTGHACAATAAAEDLPWPPPTD